MDAALLKLDGDATAYGAEVVTFFPGPIEAGMETVTVGTSHDLPANTPGIPGATMRGRPGQAFAPSSRGRTRRTRHTPQVLRLDCRCGTLAHLVAHALRGVQPR